MKRVGLHNEPALLRLVAEGDEKAFRILFNFYTDKLYNYVLRLTRREELAEEIVMDAFLKIWIRHKELSGIKHFDAYLYKIVRNQALNALKRMAHESTILKELGGMITAYNDSTEETIIHNDYQQLLHKAVNGLPPQQRLVYILSRDEGLKYEEIAIQLKISKNTVKSHLKKAVNALRTVYTNHVVTLLSGIFSLFI